MKKKMFTSPWETPEHFNFKRDQHKNHMASVTRALIQNDIAHTNAYAKHILDFLRQTVGLFVIKLIKYNKNKGSHSIKFIYENGRSLFVAQATHNATVRCPVIQQPKWDCCRRREQLPSVYLICIQIFAPTKVSTFVMRPFCMWLCRFRVSHGKLIKFKAFIRLNATSAQQAPNYYFMWNLNLFQIVSA